MTGGGWRKFERTWGAEMPHVADLSHWVNDRIKEILTEQGERPRLDFLRPHDRRTITLQPEHEVDALPVFASGFFTYQRKSTGEFFTICAWRPHQPAMFMTSSTNSSSSFRW